MPTVNSFHLFSKYFVSCIYVGTENFLFAKHVLRRHVGTFEM